MTTEDLDLVRYATIPTLDVPTTVTLATEVLARVPQETPAGVRKAARRVRTALDALRAGWQASAPPTTEVERREADLATDNAWAALQRRLAALAQLPADRYPEAVRAAVLLTLLFADGLRFLTLPWKTQWAEGDKRLQQIESQKLAPEIDALAGPAFLAEVRRTHQIYGEVLGIVAPLPEAPAAPAVGEPLLELRRALKRYALQVIATADEENPASVQAVTQALAPIEAARPVRGKPAEPAEPAPQP